DPAQAKAEAAARRAKKAAEAAERASDTGGAEEKDTTPAPPARLIAVYRDKIIPELKQKYGYKNTMAVPRLEKIVISMGLGKAVTAGEKGKMEQAEKELGVIA